MAKVKVADKRAPDMLRVLNIIKEELDMLDIKTHVQLLARVEARISTLPKDNPLKFKNKHQVLAILRREGFMELNNGVLRWSKDEFPNIHTARKLVAFKYVSQKEKDMKRGKNSGENAKASVDEILNPPDPEPVGYDCRAIIEIDNGEIVVDIREGKVYSTTIQGVSLSVKAYKVPIYP